PMSGAIVAIVVAPRLAVRTGRGLGSRKTIERAAIETDPVGVAIAHAGGRAYPVSAARGARGAAVAAIHVEAGTVSTGAAAAGRTVLPGIVADRIAVAFMTARA